MPEFSDLWLWSRGKAVYWLSPEGCGHLKPRGGWPALRNPQARAQLRHGNATQSLEEAVGQKLARVIQQQLTDDRVLRLHLGVSLLPALQNLDWGWLRLGGQQLCDHLLVEHHSPEPYDFAEVAKSDTLDLLDFWSGAQGEDDPFQSIVWPSGFRLNARWGGFEIDAELSTHELKSHCGLCIVAHGNKDSVDRPFLTERGEPWAFPRHKAPPPLVLLLACGDAGGNLLTYGEGLLQQDAVAVIAPEGELDASSTARFLEAFVGAWSRGERVDSALWEARQTDVGKSGAHRLQLLGNGSLRRHTEKARIERPLEEVAQEAHEPDQLKATLDLLSLQRFQKTGGFADIVYELYKALGWSWDDPHGGREIYDRLAAVAKDVWPVTQDWLMPYMASLAQVHDHAAIRQYERMISNRGVSAAVPEDPLFYYFLAEPNYRNGKYVLAARKLCLGLRMLGERGQSLCTMADVKLLGTLLNVLTDMNMPGLGQAVGDLLERCLRIVDESPDLGYGTARFTYHDRRARLLVRQGNLQGAIARFRIKREEAMSDYGASGRRELANLALVGAWETRRSVAEYASEAYAELKDVSGVASEILTAGGLNDPVYLLRAYGALAWLHPDEVGRELLSQYVRALGGEYKRKVDNGPYGAIILYAALCGDGRARELWPGAEQGLEKDEYWFELSVYNALLGNRKRAEDNLRKFQGVRRDVIRELAGLEGLALLDRWPAHAEIEEEVAERESLERTLLCTDAVSPEELARNGIIPI